MRFVSKNLKNAKLAATRFVSDDSGATALEYALVTIILGGVVAVGATAMGAKLGLMFTSIGTSISTHTVTF